jgi:hypothetical protein
MATRRVACCQLHCLDVGPYLTGLLKHGLIHLNTQEWLSIEPALLGGMEYSMAVGMMLMCEVADINKQVDQVEEIAIEASKDAKEASDMRREMMELGWR